MTKGQLWFLRRSSTLPGAVICPAVAGCLMLSAGSMPWLKDPLGASYTAWNLPIDIGWQFHVGVLNYGLLCICCAAFAFLVSYAHCAPYLHWSPFKGSYYFLHKHTKAGWLCTIPCMLFVFQFLCVDVGWLEMLAQHKTQMLLVQYHLGYSVSPERIPLDPFHLDSSTLLARLQLLVNQFSVGLLPPCLSAWLLIGYRSLSRIRGVDARNGEPFESQLANGLRPEPGQFANETASLHYVSGKLQGVEGAGLRLRQAVRNVLIRARLSEDLSPPQTPLSAPVKKLRRYAWPVIALLLVIVLGRAPASIYCEFQAKAALASGNYANALGWLNAALTFNPALDQAAYFHEERGEALYFLHGTMSGGSDGPGDDSRVYLASVYREQGDYLDAYQQLLAVWQAHRAVPWVVHEMSSTLVRLTEFTHVIGGPLTRRQITDDSALPWLQTLAQVDPTNVYSRYVIARIDYDLHNYPACIAQMQLVLQLSAEADAMSSAYTYLALSEAGQGRYVLERALLEKAINLDPGYRNNTAREELSGLR